MDWQPSVSEWLRITAIIKDYHEYCHLPRNVRLSRNINKFNYQIRVYLMDSIHFGRHDSSAPVIVKDKELGKLESDLKVSSFIFICDLSGLHTFQSMIFTLEEVARGEDMNGSF